MKIKKFNEINEKWTQDDRQHIDVDPNENEITCEPNEMYCPWCGSEQAYAHPSEIINDDGRYDCEVCEKPFYVEEVYHLVCGKIN